LGYKSMRAGKTRDIRRRVIPGTPARDKSSVETKKSFLKKSQIKVTGRPINRLVGFCIALAAKGLKRGAVVNLGQRGKSSVKPGDQPRNPRPWAGWKQRKYNGLQQNGGGDPDPLKTHTVESRR